MEGGKEGKGGMDRWLFKLSMHVRPQVLPIIGLPKNQNAVQRIFSAEIKKT
jgi:hypothetical protein